VFFEKVPTPATDADRLMYGYRSPVSEENEERAVWGHLQIPREMALFVVVCPFNDVCEGDRFSDISDFDCDSLTDLGVRNDDDKPLFNMGEAVALLAEGFNFDSFLFTFCNRRIRFIVVAVGVRSGVKLGRVVGAVANSRENGHSIRGVRFKTVNLKLSFWNLNQICAVAFLNSGGRQTLRGCHRRLLTHNTDRSI
jgi:hypothetical protein